MDDLTTSVERVPIYLLDPLRGQTHRLHNSGRRRHIVPTACERKSLLIGTCQGGLTKRLKRSENQIRAGQCGATRSRLTPYLLTLSRTPGSRAIGGKAYRRDLGHICTMASRPKGAGCEREYQSTSECSHERRTGQPPPGQTLSI